MDYLEFNFEIDPPEPGSEILIAELDFLGFESFLQHEKGIYAYIPKEEFEAENLSGLHILQSKDFNISYSSREIEHINWNQVWETNFKPIVVDDLCGVRAPFHPEPELKYDLVIEPKMSFGTGHHATTHMMIQFLLRHNFDDERVLDIGCGTGVLAILAEKRGAESVDAIDIDNWCYQNTLENIERNGCRRIDAYEGTVQLIEGKSYNCIIANINRNILLEDISLYSKSLKKGGILYLSGFYVTDMEVIKKECTGHQLEYVDFIEREEWVAVKFLKK